MDKYLMNIRTDDDMFMMGLKRGIALERGIHFFYETIFYTAVITAAIWEGYRIAQHYKEENRQNKQKLMQISLQLDSLIADADQVLKEDDQMKQYFEKNLSGTGELLTEMLNHTEAILQRERRLQSFIEEASRSEEILMDQLKVIEARAKK